MLELLFRYIGRVVLKNGTQRRVFTHIALRGESVRYRPPKPAWGEKFVPGNEAVAWWSLHMVGQANTPPGIIQYPWIPLPAVHDKNMVRDDRTGVPMPISRLQPNQKPKIQMKNVRPRTHRIIDAIPIWNSCGIWNQATYEVHFFVGFR